MEERHAYYRNQAAAAQGQADRVKAVDDKLAWLRLARDWLALLPKGKQSASATFDANETKRGTGQRKSDESH